jgi:hypothetical protein
MHVLINVKSSNNISKWQMGFNSAFKGLSCRMHYFLSSQSLLITMVGTDRCCLATSLATYRNIPEIMVGVRFRQEKKRILYIRVREPADCNAVSCSSLTHHCYKKKLFQLFLLLTASKRN